MRRIAIWSIWLWPHGLLREANGGWRMHGPRGRRRLGWTLTLAAAWALAMAWPWGAPGRWGHSCRRRAPFWWWDRVLDAVLRRGLAGLLAWLWPGEALRRHSWRRRLPAGTIAAILMGVTAVAAPSMTPRGEGELGGSRIDRMGTAEGGGAGGAGGAGTGGTPLLQLAGLADLPGSLAGGAGGGSGAGQGSDNGQPASDPTDTGKNDPEKPTDEPPPPPGEPPTGEFRLPTGLMNGGSVAGGPVYGGLGGGSSSASGSGGAGGGGGGGGSGGGTTPGDPGDPGATSPSDPPLLVEPPGEGGQPDSDPDGGVIIFDPPRQPVTPDEPFTPDPGLFDPRGGDPRDNPSLLPVVEPRDPAPEGHDELTGVPEPAAWLLMILGFGAIGASLRRRPAILRD